MSNANDGKMGPMYTLTETSTETIAGLRGRVADLEAENARLKEETEKEKKARWIIEEAWLHGTLPLGVRCEPLEAAERRVKALEGLEELREAAQKLVAACRQADKEGDLTLHVDFAMMKAVDKALVGEEAAPGEERRLPISLAKLQGDREVGG
jgi:hypothetical protein